MKKLVLCFLTALIWTALSGQTTDVNYTADIEQHRQHYKQEFLEDSRAPLTAKDTALLDFFPADQAWQVTATFERTPDAKPFEMPTYSGKKKPFVRYGYATFTVAGKDYKLALYQNLRVVKMDAYKDYLFLPFKDHSNGATTYGGGRYLDFRTADISGTGTIVLDFNKAYNPWCAYSDGYNCPIPPVENHLNTSVDAGERNYKGEKKH